MRFFLSKLTLLVLIFSLASCAGENNGSADSTDSSANSKDRSSMSWPSPTEFDFESDVNLQLLTSSELEEELRDNGDLYNNDMDDEPLSEVCEFENKLIVNRSENVFTMDQKLDYSDCLKESLSQEQVDEANTIESTMDVQMYLKCDVGDLSKMPTQIVFGDLNEYENMDTCTKGQYKSSISMTVDFDGKTTLGNQKLKIFSKTMLGGNPQGNEFSSCSGDEESRFSNCVDYSFDRVEKETNGQTTIEVSGYKIYRKNVHYINDDDPYYDSGSIDFVVNDWQGTVVYSGANVTPEFTAESGSVSTSGRLKSVAELSDASTQLARSVRKATNALKVELGYSDR